MRTPDRLERGGSLPKHRKIKLICIIILIITLRKPQKIERRHTDISRIEKNGLLKVTEGWVTSHPPHPYGNYENRVLYLIDVLENLF